MTTMMLHTLSILTTELSITVTFIRQWPLFIEHLATEMIDIYIVGDMNFYLDSDTNTYVHKFKDLLSTCDLKQHINELTHRKPWTSL